MSRDLALAIAKQYAKEHSPSYYSEPFTPHEWVVEAIEYALEMGYCKGLNTNEEANATHPN
ncbi:hypothetical protein [Stenotrophomonas phage StenR_269]|nr:hypothetical protein [Stenotrophomonas phage StenR_269]